MNCVGIGTQPLSFKVGERRTMKTIRAVYENGVFRPVVPVDLPEHSAVEFEPRLQGTSLPEEAEEPERPPPMSEGLAKIYAVLGERYKSGVPDTAARHNEHQP
jgi:predicted DNA-binding antitoxin AbrB/MazE fold protein